MNKCDKPLDKEKKMFQSSVQIDFKRHNELPILSRNGHRVTGQVWLLTDDHIVNRKKMPPKDDSGTVIIQLSPYSHNHFYLT